MGKQGRGSAMSTSRVRAGKNDPTDAQRVALQIAFYIGEDQDPQYLKWLFAQFASDNGGCSADDHDAAKLTAGLSGDSHMAEASESGVVTSASDRDSDEDHWQVCQVCEGQGHY